MQALFRAFEHYPQWNWDSQYTKSAYLSTDQAALNRYFTPATDHHVDIDRGNDMSEQPALINRISEEICTTKKVYST